MNNKRDDALTSVNCPRCHAPTAVGSHPVPPLTTSEESGLDRMRSKFEPGDKNGTFNACPECGMLWAGAAHDLKNAVRDEPTGEKGRQTLFRTLGWIDMILGIALIAYGLFANFNIVFIGAGVVVCAGAVVLLALARKERGSKRRSGIAAD